MNFVQLEYVVFLAVVVYVSLRLPTPGLRKSVLLAASYYFYAYWDYRFTGLLVFSTLLDYSIGRLLAGDRSQATRRALLILSLSGNLGLLAFFKYYNFFIESAQAVFSRWGLHGGTLEIILPIGISFYTFQTLSYTIDVYRRKLAPCRSLLDFAVYVAFFPQLVAGPIVRAAEFLPQLQRMHVPRAPQVYSGLAQILRGYVKKVLIADHLATFVDPVFGSPEMFSQVTVWLAVLAYAGQIYGDFAGYSDIAIGSARLLGFEVPENFRHPYLSRSPSEFWRRWHITLSTWLRDYLYIPLGGSREGQFNTYKNLMITMTLGGLWHGASWNFVLWGVWHGLILCLFRGVRFFDSDSRLARGCGIMLTFSLVLISWTLFRTADLDHLFRLWGRMLTFGGGLTWLPPIPLIAAAALVVEHALWAAGRRRALLLDPEHRATPWLVGFAIAALVLFAPQEFRPFVYFQF